MTYVFLDTETTGLDPNYNQIWELAYAVDEGPIYSHFLPHSPATFHPEALKVNRYEERYVAPSVGDALAFEAGARFYLEGATLVAANPAFDAGFLRARWGCTPWKYRLLDVEAYAMAALHLDEPKGLAYIAEQLGIPAPDHTAAQDVATLRAAFYTLRSIYDERLL
jgi:DNA polymerase III epsilon subunit-like protein